MLALSSLQPKRGSRKKKVRLGRGEGSGSGKTSGKGGKGQTARTGGKIRAGFEGGQMPLYRRLPKIGFLSRKGILGLNKFNVINLSDLERFPAGAVVDHEALRALGLCKHTALKAGVKVLGAGQLTKKLTLKVHAISTSAKSAVEKLGGSVEILS